MTDNVILVHYTNAINSVIHDTFVSTQRIKLTTFDVSLNYIIFGANSGGIYIFKRIPCEFYKIIPSTYGPTDLIAISLNEERLAIAVSSGLIIILENFFDASFEQQIFSEHENSTVTALKWNGSNLYSGDCNGKVSVITLNSFLPKSIFQPPISCLMNLDSQIIQLDTHEKYLLVATNTRTLLCDTETERFRQIGKKLRDGPYGCCFIQNSIYCARPGMRLWQANFEANVVITHQLRTKTINFKESDIFQYNNNDSLEISNGLFSLPEIFFREILLSNGLIIGFWENGIWGFDPSSSSLKFWHQISNIKNLKVIDNYLFIWSNDLDFSVFSTMTIEDLIIKSLFDRKFSFCGELCMKFYQDVKNSLTTSKQIHLILALEAKLSNLDLLEKLKPIFDDLRNLAKLPVNLQKLNGIVTVSEAIKNTTKIDASLVILNEQFKINQIQNSIETLEFKTLMKNLTIDNLYKLLKQFENDTDGAHLWCRHVFLKNFTTTESTEILDYALNAFLDVNKSDLVLNCMCSFPLPKAYKTEIEFPEIGLNIIEITHTWDLVLSKLPQMYGAFLQKAFPKQLELLIQFSNPKLFELYLKEITYDFWDESIRYLAKLKSNVCLNCGLELDSTDSLSWTDFGVLMSDSITPKNAIKLFQRYAKLLDLKPLFYQYCILQEVTKFQSNILKQSLVTDTGQEKLETSVAGYIRRKYLKIDNYDESVLSIVKCAHCHLPIKNEVLEEVQINCCHKYHQVCFIYNNNQCYLCDL